MIGPFLRGFALAFALAIVVFAGLGFATQALLFQPPPDRFYTRGVSFEYPAGWVCTEAAQEVVCEPTTQVDDSIIVIANTTVGPLDSLDVYRARLSQPLNGVGSVLNFGDITLGGQVWIDSTQAGSEITKYTTRYLATIVGPVALLLSFSCEETICEAMRPEIDRLAASVQVVGSTI